MGKRTGYDPGTFSWMELATPDPAAAKTFYGSLFGWEAEDNPIPAEAGGGVYTTLKLSGESVAALYEQLQDQREAGIPPNWFSYVTVADADAAAARAKELGGAVQAGPFDVMTQGRMAVISDPTGAVFGVWQARDSIGATLVNDPGCLTANELSTNDVQAAIRFYEGLFGWKVNEVDSGGGPPYWTIEHAGAAEGRNGGMRELAPEQQGAPPHWMPYFTAASLDDSLATITGAGGAVHVGPIEIPAGRIAVAADPQGAFFGLFEGPVDD
jgi:predicted enzyme related to lactoylglutathione lyase